MAPPVKFTSIAIIWVIRSWTTNQPNSEVFIGTLVKFMKWEPNSIMIIQTAEKTKELTISYSILLAWPDTFRLNIRQRLLNFLIFFEQIFIYKRLFVETSQEFENEILASKAFSFKMKATGYQVRFCCCILNYMVSYIELWFLLMSSLEISKIDPIFK